ncbi:MAG: glycoside hydrolase family 172 protein [Bryobacteraceae bacterium]
MSSPDSDGRRGFLRSTMTLAGLAAAAPGAALAQSQGTEFPLPRYARAQNCRSLKQSSHDPAGGNADFRRIAPGGILEVFNSPGPGVISHLWFTISAQSPQHLKELVLRAYWDGCAKPSVECPIGDFFGLNLGQYQIYESAYLACSPGKSLNCYFAMPFRKSARLTVTNESAGQVGSFYSNIDYLLAASLPEDTLYFHAQYRQAAPCVATVGERFNTSGTKNYVYLETRGRGHLMGVTLGVLQNADGWMGEGNDMIFVDDETRPAIIGTGTEDYFLGSWDFGGREGSTPFAHRYYGAPLIVQPERRGGQYCCYRWHGDNPVTFTRYLRHTMEHGHANDRGDNFYSVGYWYQAEPYTDFPPLAPVAERIPRVRGG